MAFKDNRGSALITFLAFFPIIVGIIIFSLYLGEQTQEHIRIRQVSQLGSDALASHSAQGLNMMAINNQAMAASLQIHNSSLVISYYGGIIRAFMYNLKDAAKDLKNSIKNFKNEIGSSIQEDIFNITNNYAHLFINNASGLTLYNQKLASFWNYGALSSGAHIVGQNLPTAISFPLQGDGTEASRIPYSGFGYKYLETSKPEDAICTTFATPKSKGNPHEVGDLATFIASPVLKLTNGGQSKITKFLNNILNGVDKFSFLRFTTTECGVALRSPLRALFDPKTYGIDSNEIAKATDKILKSLDIFNFVKEIAGFHPDGIPSCSVQKGWVFTGLGTAGVLINTVSDSIRDQVFEAKALKVAYEKGVREIRYSEITPEQCNEVEHIPNSRCNKTMTLNSKTHLCPLYFTKAPAKENKVIKEIFLDKCLATKMRWYGPEIYSKKPKEELQKKMFGICKDYIPWRVASQRDKDFGFRLLNVAKQSNFYLGDTHNERLKYKIKGGSKKHTLGFTYIKKLDYPQFLKHQSFKMAIGEPTLTVDEAIKVREKCPLVIKGISEVNGKVISKCRINTASILGHEITPKLRDKAEDDDRLVSILSGGVRDVNDEREGLFSRMQWGFSKSRTLFARGENDPNPPHFFKTMWPAWNIAPGKTGMSEFFKPSSDGIYKTANMIDYILGNKKGLH